MDDIKPNHTITHNLFLFSAFLFIASSDFDNAPDEKWNTNTGDNKQNYSRDEVKDDHFKSDSI